MRKWDRWARAHAPTKDRWMQCGPTPMHIKLRTTYMATFPVLKPPVLSGRYLVNTSCQYMQSSVFPVLIKILNLTQITGINFTNIWGDGSDSVNAHMVTVTTTVPVLRP